MDSIYVTYAIPFFLVLIGLEVWYSVKKKKDFYVLADSIGNLGTGIISQLLTALAAIFFSFSLYRFVYNRFAIFHWSDDSLWVWIGGYFLADLCYYWWHRMSHEINLFWAAHVIHHQSEEYNLTVALRQNWLTELTGSIFYLPLAVLGVSPEVFLTMSGFLLIYQFWIHTPVIGKMGVFESVFNTPSHHRVHHAINPQYIDKNYGAILILWDKIFGTFQPEKEKPVYGTLKFRNTLNAVRDYLDPWKDLFRQGQKGKGYERLLIFFRRPGWVNGIRPDLKKEYASRRGSKFSVQLKRKQEAALVGGFSLVFLLSSGVLFGKEFFSQGIVFGLAASALVVLSLI